MLLTPTQMAAIGELYSNKDSSKAARSFRRPGSIRSGVPGGRPQCGMATGTTDMDGGSRRSADTQPASRGDTAAKRHLRVPRPQPRRGRDVVDNGKRRAARPSPAAVRFDRATRARASVCGQDACQLKAAADPRCVSCADLVVVVMARVHCHYFAARSALRSTGRGSHGLRGSPKQDLIEGPHWDRATRQPGGARLVRR